MLYSNPDAKQLWNTLAATQSNKNLDELVNKYVKKFDYSKFDVYFEKYFA